MEYRPNPTILDRITLTCKEALKDKQRIFVAISGLPGSGKSTLGKYIRKNGLRYVGGGARILPCEIAVIDDNVMSLNLFIIRPKIKITPKNTTQRDNLKPFLRFLPPYVKVILCLGSSIQRLDKAEIFLYMDIKEEIRKARLLKREKNSNNYLDLSMASAIPILPHKYRIIIK